MLLHRSRDSWSSKYQHGTSLGDSNSWPSSLSSWWWGTVRDQVCRTVLRRDGKSTVAFWDDQYVSRFGTHRIHPLTQSDRERHCDPGTGRGANGHTIRAGYDAASTAGLKGNGVGKVRRDSRDNVRAASTRFAFRPVSPYASYSTPSLRPRQPCSSSIAFRSSAGFASGASTHIRMSSTTEVYAATLTSGARVSSVIVPSAPR